MSKYRHLWEYLKHTCMSTERLSFEEISSIAGQPFDLSFLDIKEEGKKYGISVMKVDFKTRSVLFSRNA